MPFRLDSHLLISCWMQATFFAHCCTKRAFRMCVCTYNHELMEYLFELFSFFFSIEWHFFLCTSHQAKSIDIGFAFAMGLVYYVNFVFNVTALEFYSTIMLSLWLKCFFYSCESFLVKWIFRRKKNVNMHYTQHKNERNYHKICGWKKKSLNFY